MAGALAGVRLLSLAQNVPGPVAVARLTAEGAVAVKVEPPAGDPLATSAPDWYRELHVGVRRQTLNLKTPDGRDAFDDLVAQTDVLITSQRPTALDRLGLGPARLKATAPALRSVRIVGDTREPERAGHDVTYQAEAGLLGDRLPMTLLADLVGAERVISAVLLALRLAPGTCVDVGLRGARRLGGRGRPRAAVPRPALPRALASPRRTAHRRDRHAQHSPVGGLRPRERRADQRRPPVDLTACTRLGARLCANRAPQCDTGTPGSLVPAPCSRP
jgi:hypothetical protein